MNYLFNDRNLVRAAVLSALNIVPSSAIFRTDLDPKVGSGNVSLTGPYTGQHDTTIDIQIIDGEGDSSQVSQPVFTGIGNGQLTNLSVTGLSAQDFTVQVEDLGTTTTFAQAPFQGATLQALASGESGDLISISVDPSGIVRTPIDRALQGTLSAGTNAYSGSEWDFDAGALDASGNIPDSAPRLSFGDDPQVYRAYKTYDYNAQQWVYAFSPPPVRDVAQGSIVKAVTGTWGVAVTNGTMTENYSGISLYDILSGFRATSTLLQVNTPINNNHSPNGQASTDLSVWTMPLVLSIVEDGSIYVKQAEINFTVDANAPTETVVIRCTSATVVGAEVWSVTGDISTGLPDAISGVPYAAGDYTFTIPVVIPPTGGPTANIVPEFQPQDPTSTVTMCVDQCVVGAKATNQQFTFVWTVRPPAPCDCTTGTLIGGPNADCLGLTSEGGEMSDQASVVIRQQRVASAVQQYVNANTNPSSDVAVIDVPWIEEWGNIFLNGLTTMAGGPLIDLAPWQASTVYAIDVQVQPTAKNGYRYAVTTAGTSGSSEPGSWTTTIGGTVSDGGVTWTCIDKMPFPKWDAYFEAGKTEMELLSGVGTAWNVPEWAHASYVSNYFLVAIGGGSLQLCVPSTRTGFIYAATITGTASTATTGVSEPTWPTTLGGTVVDGDFIWTAYKQYWAASTAYVLDTVINPGTGQGWKVTTAGTSSSGEPDWTLAGPITDGSVAWTRQSATDLSTLANATREVYMERFRTQMADCEAAAGIGPNFKGASSQGDGCWQDHGGNYFASQDGLLPLFPGFGYNASKLVLNEDGKLVPMSTEQFYVGLKWGCPNLLQPGDRLIITIDGVSGGPSTYQEGDNIAIVVAHQDPVPFGGGQDGNDTLMLHVHGTTDGDFPPYYVAVTVPAARQNSHAYLFGDRYVPAASNGHFYSCTVAGMSASSPPTFPTDRSTFSDGGATFQDMGLVTGYSEGGLAFTVMEGGILFALGDTWTFSSIGGHFQWRQDGGSWTGPVVIGDATPLVAGLMPNFTGGATSPSWFAGDTWSFSAEATNGPDQAMSPSDGRLTWTTSTTITITPADNGPASRFAIFDHHIPSNATITLEGSDDDFGSTPTSISITWAARDIFVTSAPVTRAKWRLVVDQPGDLFWMFLGERMQPMLRDPGTTQLKPDYGHFTKRRRMPGLGARSGVGGDILHDVVCDASYDDLMAGIDFACENDDGGFGLVINEAAAEVSLVRFASVSDTKDVLFDYQASSALNRYQSFTLTVDPLP